MSMIIEITFFIKNFPCLDLKNPFTYIYELYREILRARKNIFLRAVSVRHRLIAELCLLYIL